MFCRKFQGFANAASWSEGVVWEGCTSLDSSLSCKYLVVIIFREMDANMCFVDELQLVSEKKDCVNIECFVLLWLSEPELWWWIVSYCCIGWKWNLWMSSSGLRNSYRIVCFTFYCFYIPVILYYESDIISRMLLILHSDCGELILYCSMWNHSYFFHWYIYIYYLVNEDCCIVDIFSATKQLTCICMERRNIFI